MCDGYIASYAVQYQTLVCLEPSMSFKAKQNLVTEGEDGRSRVFKCWHGMSV